jgi:hypothetical protein
MKKLRHYRALALCAAAAVLAGCASNSNFYTGKSLGKGNAEGFAAVSHISTQSDTIPIIEKIPDFTFFEAGAAIGLTDRLDIGVKYTFPLAGFVQARYMLAGLGRQEGMFFAGGLRVGYTSFPHSTSDTSGNDRVEIAVPVYLSYYPADFLAFTMIPTYSCRFFTDEKIDYMENLVGGNVNIRVGKKVGFIGEFSYFHNLYWKWNELQFGGGVVFPVPSFW